MRLLRGRARASRVEPSIGGDLPAVQNNEHAYRELKSIDELSELLGIGPSVAGPVVTSRTAMRMSVVYACTRLIAGAMATMPVHIYLQGERGPERDSAHPLAPILNLQPHPLLSAAMFWEYITTCMLLEGDGFAVILRDNWGDPVELLPINPTLVQVTEYQQRLLYSINIGGVQRGFDQDDVLHFAGFGFNGLRSLSVIKHAAVNSIGLGMAMEQFSGDFFHNGAQQRIAVVKEGKWDPTDQESFRQAWVRTYAGVENAKYPLTIGKGLDIKQLSVNAKDAQMLESRQFENINICTAFGLPAFLVNQGDKVTAWGSGMAEMGLAFVRYTLTPHIVRWQQEMNRKLFMRTRHYCEFQTAGLIRGTLKERNDAYKSALGGSNVPGYMSINEVRRLENLMPIADAEYDKPYHPGLAAARPVPPPAE